ncbi:D-psicose/D-tagatose/L-ribulose 3-epimerase [Pseudoxanthobacter soli DSM 19599]|uniref:D-psicose/D-tagatose/L-ribulose 3-epimerase n=1 Tax=Pseudoxanthobacter soli DSM 19599 TaxID=1123029 RepID=A0A1M7ZA45_9HYPH|nr:sugar phosphate isomerase/epimerase family protein [Pseudoxanthobacter soli]SHO61754.1 D-psicose/D-tagatose/L-ribulose 3-epimerase [Pseudoxanthobacter soli DSM 19599]
MNPIGLISMQYARPFTAEHFPLFATMREHGYDFVELLVPEVGEIDAAAARRALDEAGLGIVLAARVNLQRNLASADADAHRAGIEYLKYTVDQAVALGATVVGGPLTGNPLVFAGRPPQPVEESERLARKQRCVDGLREAGDYAAKAGIVLAVEPLNRFESDVLCTTQQGLELLDAVDHPAVKLMLDTFHMHMEESSIAEAILLAGDRVAHFQANENHRGFPGTGATDWVAVCRALHEIGYTGPISLEPFRRRDDRFGVPFAQWRAPHEDESDRLSASVAFMKSHLTLTEYRR